MPTPPVSPGVGALPGSPPGPETPIPTVPGEQVGPTDGALVRQALAGSSPAFEALVQRYQALVYLVAYRQVARTDQVEDIAQETFVKAFLHLSELDEPDRFKSWLLRITANLSLDYLRRRKHQGASLDETATFVAAEAAAAAHPKDGAREANTLPESRELRQQIAEAIYALPDEYQVPAAMRYLEDIPYRDIARKLGLREEAVRKRIHRANQMLRVKLRKVWPEGEGA
jgi:RNA polymerase sigma-70 factor (ECF subfamily)